MLCVCVTILVLRLHHKDAYPQPPEWLENLLLRKPIRVGSETVLVKEQNTSERELSHNKAVSPCINCAKSKGTMEEKGNCKAQNSEKWKEIAGVINRISFLVLISALTITFVICAILWSLG